MTHVYLYVHDNQIMKLHLSSKIEQGLQIKLYMLDFASWRKGTHKNISSTGKT